MKSENSGTKLTLIAELEVLQKSINDSWTHINNLIAVAKGKDTHEKYMDIVKQCVDGENDTLIEATKDYTEIQQKQIRLELKAKVDIKTTIDKYQRGGYMFIKRNYYIPPLFHSYYALPSFEEFVVTYPHSKYASLRIY